MARLIKDWKELEGLESDNYKIKLDYFEEDVEHNDPHSGWVVNKNTGDIEYYLSTHTFYGSQYQESTKVLQGYRFDVEIDNWDKDDPRWAPKEPKLTTNQRKIKEFKEKANRPNASDNDVKKLIRACGGDVNKAVALITEDV